MTFYAEKQIEDYLTEETRELTMPDGSIKSVTTRKITWEQFDSMHEGNYWSNEDLIRMSFNWYKREQEYDFTEYFWNLVGFAYSDVKKKVLGHSLNIKD